MDGRQRLLDFRSGGWLILLTVALVAALVAGWVLPLLDAPGRAVGDGRNVDTYGFDLEGCLVPRDRVVAAGFPRNGLPTLDRPAVMGAGEVAAFNESHRGKYLVPGDLVVGVEIGGDARAYPIRVLNWHEVVNDTLGGVPIAVTYHPLCDSAVVFDRRVGGDVVEFGISGLLYNSNLLMYDRRPGPAGGSLWSQLQARAVAGPAAREGAVLDVLPASLARWDHWKLRHPGTTVLRPDEGLFQRYQRDPYGNYLTTKQLRFPVDPMPPRGGTDPMARVTVIEGPGGRWIRAVDGGTGPAAEVESVPGATVSIEGTEPPRSVLVSGGDGIRTYHARWFAWYSHHPGTARPVAAAAGPG